jgi:two-component system, sporulation sensor kinase E
MNDRADRQMQEKRTFAGKFISRLDKIDRAEIENFLATLLHEKNFLELVLHNLLEGLIVTDERSHILFINSTASELIGLSPRRQRLGQVLSSVIRDPALRDFLTLQRKGGISGEVEVSFPQKAIYSVNVVPVQDKQKKTSAYLMIIADITGKRRSELEQQQREKLISLAMLTAGVAHEIKNPLNSLNIHAQILKKVVERCPTQSTADSDRIHRSIDIIVEETNRLGRIVDQFILAVRPTKPRLSLLNVNDVLRNVVERLRPELEGKNITLELVLDSEVPPSRMDGHQIGQAFINILKNSIEAIDKEHGIIRIQSAIADGFVRIAFKDNGCGIKKEDLTRIFEPYYSTKFYGSGLGLMIVYRIISEHQGDIKLQSEPGKGTTLTVLLPLTRKPVRLIEETAGTNR